MTALASRCGLVGFALLLGALTAALAAQAQATKQSAPPPSVEASQYKITGPFTHENLTLFLIHGPDRIKNRNLLTLQEGLEQKKVVVHETQQVNELAIENLSPADEVFVQSGDIVKGGKQDRVIAYDVILPPKSGKMPIASFCVEAGRWRQRGRENAMAFEVSNAQAATKGLKNAVRAEMDQQKVWEDVAQAQMKLARNEALLPAPTTVASPTSLQLTLEQLEKATAGHVKKLSPIVQDKNDVIGYAVAVNGVVEGADVYASHALFLKVWPMLLKGSAVEAVVEQEKKGTPAKHVTVDTVRAFLAEAEKGKASEKDVTNRVRLVKRETKKASLFISNFEGAAAGQPAPVRASYIAR
jgi:hypothetical protein